MAWTKKYDNTNIPLASLDTDLKALHDDLVTAYGAEFHHVINYVPPENEGGVLPHIELEFENEPGDLTAADNAVNTYKEQA